MAPFFVFPKIGYLNTQFQFYTHHKNIKIELLKEGVAVNEFSIDEDNTITISSLNEPGKYIARSTYENQEFDQELEIQDAYIYGSSVLKNVYVFDNIPYTFIVMKDRTIIYDEIQNKMYYEYAFSPDNILQHDENNLIFLTNISDGIVTIGLYNLKTLSISGELLNYSSEIIFYINNNLWLTKQGRKELICFYIINNNQAPLEISKCYTTYIDFLYCKQTKVVFIEYEKNFLLINLLKNEEILIEKSENLSIDLNGYIYKADGKYVEVFSPVMEKLSIVLIPYLNVNLDKFFYVGDNFKKESINENDLRKKLNKFIVNINYEEVNQNRILAVQTDDETSIDQISEQEFYPTINGVYCIGKIQTYKINKIQFVSEKEGWKETLSYSKFTKYNFSLITNNEQTIIQENKDRIFIQKYQYPFIIKDWNKKNLFCKYSTPILTGKECLFKQLNDDWIVISHSENTDAIYKFGDDLTVLYNGIKILNKNTIQTSNTIWFNYTDLDDNKLKIGIFNLSSGEFITREHNVGSIKFCTKYAVKDEQTLIETRTGETIGDFIGNIKNLSSGKEKYITRRGDSLLLYKKNIKGDYDYINIELNIEKYNEAYLSPNGKFLVLSENVDELLFYDIKENKVISFFNGSFIKFTNEGSVVYNDKKLRTVKIFDPVTLKVYSNSNYRDYTYINNDGSLYVSNSLKIRYYDKLTNQELQFEAVKSLEKNFDSNTDIIDYDINNNIAALSLKARKYDFFNKNKDALLKLSIEKADDICSKKLYTTKYYIVAGIVNTSKSIEIEVSNSLVYFNYAAFSYDNKYLGIVGKPQVNGYIKIISLNYDKELNTLSYDKDCHYETYELTKAAWVCAFSKNGFFATYDSDSNTYLMKLSDDIFSKLNEHSSNKKNYLSRFKQNSFLCFSPSGRLFALSIQGYSPYALGGSGHWGSDIVKVASIGDIEEGIIKNINMHVTYKGFGDTVSKNSFTAVNYAAFSDDETKLMVLCNDGVCVVRNIKNDMENSGYKY